MGLPAQRFLHAAAALETGSFPAPSRLTTVLTSDSSNCNSPRLTKPPHGARQALRKSVKTIRSKMFSWCLHSGATGCRPSALAGSGHGRSSQRRGYSSLTDRQTRGIRGPCRVARATASLEPAQASAATGFAACAISPALGRRLPEHQRGRSAAAGFAACADSLQRGRRFPRAHAPAATGFATCAESLRAGSRAAARCRPARAFSPSIAISSHPWVSVGAARRAPRRCRRIHAKRKYFVCVSHVFAGPSGSTRTNA